MLAEEMRRGSCVWHGARHDLVNGSSATSVHQQQRVIAIPTSRAFGIRIAWKAHSVDPAVAYRNLYRLTNIHIHGSP
ncbi:hypothetical protein [Nocardia cyriacigeorgica]|uniref:hypothetical protein n=1 Tax=Nocardia cyriacigeorgica TaxID=135487 RepID=UPI000301AA6C|nr:hypothetical protein [Nocardia cyriacigeorgica]